MYLSTASVFGSRSVDGGDAQRPSSDRARYDALDDIGVGHDGSCLRAECSMAAVFRHGRHYVESVKSATLLYKENRKRMYERDKRHVATTAG